MNDDQKFLDLNGLRHLAQKEREAYNSMIIVSDEKPLNQPYNKVWMKETTEEFAVPTYAEFQALEQRVARLETAIAELTNE